MKKPLYTLATAAMLALVVPALAHAQAPTRPRAGADADARRAMRQDHRDAVKAKWESMTPAQRDALKASMKAYAEERKSLRAQVKAGTIDKKTAAEKLKAFREANKPAKP